MMSGEVRTDVRAKRELKKHGWRWGRFCRWHLKHGWVVSVPDLFAAGYFYEDDGEVICYVTYARGDVRVLESLFRLNLNNLVDKVEFHKHFTESTVRIRFKKLMGRFQCGKETS